jgi:hypothetical protein
MRTHVSRTVSACFGILRHLRRLRRSVTESVFQSLVASLVLTKLDYSNATLAGVPAHQIHRLQAVMNAAARLIFHASRHDHITPLLRRLHWLRAPERITYKLAVLTFRCLHGLAPEYLSAGLVPVAAVSSRLRLHSASASLIVPRSCRSTIGDRAFRVAAPRVWNDCQQT